MKKKIKLLISIAGFCLSLAVFAFGVIAGINVAYVAQGVINYQIEEANVSIETRVYSTSKKFNSQEDFEQTAKIIEHSEFAKLNSQTTLDEEFDFKSVQLKNISTPSAFSETNPDYVDKYTNRDNPTPPNDLVLDLDYEYKSSSRTMAYFVVIKVINESPFPIYTQVKTKGAEGDENIYKAPENSYTYKTAKIEILQPAKQNEAYPYTYICFAMGIEDAGWEMDEVEFNYPIIVNQDDPQTGAFSRPYVAQVENVFSQTTEGETQISSTGSTLTNVPVSTYMGAIGYSILNLVLPTTTQATSDVVITLSMSLSMGGQTENLTPLIEMVALIPIKCSTIDECLANEGNALQIMPELSSDQTYYTITIPTSVLSSTRTDLTVLPMIDVDMAVNIESAQIGVDYILSTTQEGVAFNDIKTITEWGMVDYKKMSEEFNDPVNVEITTVSMGTESMSFSASLRNFQLRNIPTDAQAIRVSFTTSNKVQAAFVMNGQKEVLTIMDMMMVLEGEVESIAGIRNNTTTIDFPVTSTQDGTMDFYVCLYYYQTMVSDGEEIPLTLKVEYVEFTEEESPLLFELNTDSNLNLYWRITGVKDLSATDISIPAYYKNLPIKEMYSDIFKNNTTIQSITFEEGCGFNSIYSYQFSGCTNLQSITFGPNVQISSIGSYAFKNCSNLKNFEIPASITIVESNAFAESGVENITFEEGSKLTYLSNHLFQNCTSLNAIEIPSSITNIGSNTFSGCTKLSSVTFKQPSALTTINSYAFQNCTSLTSIDLPDSVTTINSYAFQNCTSLTSIDLPDSVTTINSNAFTGSSLTEFVIPTGVSNLNQNVFSGCSKLETIKIKDNSNLKTISNYAFQNLTVLKTIEIGSSVTSIGTYAFSGCTGLTNIIFKNPSSLTTINSYAFTNCTGLKQIDIPNSVNSIANYAFNNCSNLKKVNISNLQSWMNITFGGTSANPLIYAGNLYLNNVLVNELVVPQSITTIKSYAFYGCQSITGIKLSNSVTTISSYAFQNCYGVSSIEIPSSVTSIGTSAFSANHKLVHIRDNRTSPSSSAFPTNPDREYITSGNFVNDLKNEGNYRTYTIKNENGEVVKKYLIGLVDYSIKTINNLSTYGITEIYQYAFYNNKVLTEITIPNTVKTIGSYAFYGCDNLTIKYESGLSLTSIGDYAFYNQSNLTSFTIPASVISIGKYAFANCSNLREVVFETNSHLQKIDDCAFQNCSQLATMSLPGSLTYIGNNAFNNTSWYNSNVVNGVHTTQSGAKYAIKLPSGVTSFNFSGVTLVAADFAYNLTTLTTLSNTTSIKYINDFAFYGCSAITSINIPNVIEIGNYAFRNCKQLISTGITTTTPLTKIGDSAFYYCQNLQSITIPSTVKSIGSYGFSVCSKMTSLYIADLNAWLDIDFGNAYANPMYNPAAVYINGNLTTSVQIPNTIEVLKPYAFYDAKLTDVTFEANSKLTKISESAFYGIDATTIDIPDSVTYIDASAFNNSSLNTINISNQSKLEYIGNTAFANCKIKTINIPLIVKTIGNNVFENCYNLTQIIIPQNVTTMGTDVFKNCYKLVQIKDFRLSPSASNFIANPDAEYITSGDFVNVLEYGQKYITYYIKDSQGNITKTYLMGVVNNSITVVTDLDSYNFTGVYQYAFYQGEITQFEFSNSITEIGASSFSYARKLEEIEIIDSITSIGKNAFYYASGLLRIKYSANLTESYEDKYVFSYAGVSTGCQLEFGDNVTFIASELFYNSNILNFDLTGIETIEREAFSSCKLITSLVIPSTVKRVEWMAFKGMTSLTEILIEAENFIDSYEYIFDGSGASTGCRVTFGPNVTSIEHNLFTNSRVTEIEISNNITYIENAFYQSSTINTLICWGSVPPTLATVYGSDILSQISGLSKIYVRDECIGAYKSANYWSGKSSIIYGVSTYGWVKTSSSSSTCTTKGVVTYTKDSLVRTFESPLAPHNVVDGHCTVCGQEILVSATITETAAGSSYGFIGVNGTYTSNNQDKHSTSAIAEISTQTGCTLTINWTVSSESNYDKLYIYLNGSAQSSVNGVSGSQSGTLTLNLAAGDVVQIKYQKDGSANSGNDCATFTFTYQ